MFFEVFAERVFVDGFTDCVIHLLYFLVSVFGDSVAGTVFKFFLCHIALIFGGCYCLIGIKFLYLHNFYFDCGNYFRDCSAKLEQISVISKYFAEKITVKIPTFTYMAENETIKERLIFFIKHLNIGQGKFEAQCGLANGYVNNIRRSVTPDKLQQIARQYPELNTGWLMTGEGEMLKATVSQSTQGDNSPNLNGDNITYSDTHIIGKFLDEIAEQRKLTESAQTCLATAQAQITDLINQNKEQFAQFMAMLQVMQTAKV